MATALVANDILEVRAQCLSGNQVAVNVLHYLVTSVSAGPVSDQQTADALSLVLGNAYTAYLSNESEYLGIRLQKVAPGVKYTYVVSDIAAGAGEVASQPLPSQACGAIVKLSSDAARRFRGLVFLPYPTEEMNEEPGVPNAAGIAAMSAWANAVLVEIALAIGGSAITLEPVIYSFGDGIVAPETRSIVDWRIQDWWITHKSRGFNRRGDLLGP